MMKRTMAVLTSSLCAVMCVSVFMMPSLAAAVLEKKQGAVFERKVPSEYMADFVSMLHTTEDNSIILAESQLDELVAIIRQKCGDVLNLDLPEDFVFEYDAVLFETYDGEVVNITVQAHGGERHNVSLTAEFSATDFPGGQAEVRIIQINSIDNGIKGADLPEIFDEEGLKALRELTETARQRYDTDFEISVPKDLEFEYSFVISRVYGLEGEAAGLRIKAEDESQGIIFNAVFTAANLSNEPAEITQLSANCTSASNLHEGFDKLALEALKNELGLTVPDYYDLFTYLYSTYENGQPRVELTCEWLDDDAEHDKFDKSEGGTYSFSTKERFRVEFDNPDLSKRTGRITGVEKFVEFTQWSLMEEWAAPGFTKITEGRLNEMLEAAKAFLNEKGIEPGDLGRSLQISIDGKPAMYFQFGQSSLNDSSSPSVIVTITEDLKVLGYNY